ncbi:helix-turn-helix domain-containing protein [Intestinimonas massiliensis]|uniref:Helix-turn-helix domain-containing protein n=1 Tax=Intestinimonas massiliensis (ex Afouda et al. 2020) TaxID=1673721 RepID=A0AAW5JLY4_9FIRM|nr:helix-turn-helix domain-containing protein [Intestinimonas massiliensis (ex Afouda et al. 2020)]
MTFGAFISTRRKEAKLNLRDTAKHLGISNGYLCDIEQGRRPAPEGAFVERISSFLELDKQEHEMLLDLAADSRQTVPADLPDYIRQHDIVRAALRVAKEVDATDEEWKAFMERSVFYDRKREAIFLLSLCLFGYAVPELQEELEMPRLYPD